MQKTKGNFSLLELVILAAFITTAICVLSYMGAFQYSDSHSTSSNNTTTTPSSDFKILNYRGEWDESGELWIKGEIKNIGSRAGGPKLEAIARDSKGVLLDSQQFWPNSTSNIPPGDTCGISFPLTYNRNANSLELKVIDVSIW